MAKLRTIDLTARECPCGGVARPAQRYEATRTIDVLCCWSCGRENPPMYGAGARPVAFWCRYCGEQFMPTDPRQRYCSDDHARRADRITLDRKQLGGRLSRRPA